MQIMITHGSMASTRVLQFSRLQLAGAGLGLAFALMLFSGAVYHWFFLKAAREGWPVVSTVVRFVVRDEIAQRDRFMRDNLDAIAQKVGEVQAKMVKLEAVGERVLGLTGVKADDLKPATRSAPNVKAGQGGLYVPLAQPSLAQLQGVVAGLDEVVDLHADMFILAESRLLEDRLQALLVPNSRPVDTVPGSGFGFRSDPFTGRAALHTGLDFSAPVGTPVSAAAGGVVRSVETHPQYGLTLEIDHGNRLSTLYAHTSRVVVKPGDLVKRGQVVAEVGNTGRSTGPHLHFEVLVQGVPQDPLRFLAAGPAPAPAETQAQARRKP